MIMLTLFNGTGRRVYLNSMQIISMVNDQTSTLIIMTNDDRWNVIEKPEQICELIRRAKANG